MTRLPTPPLSRAFLAPSLLGLMLAFTPTDALAVDEQQFQQCLTELREQASQQGLDSELATGELDRARLDEKVLELDRDQPEFTASFARYFNQRVTDQRVQQGRDLLRTHGDLLRRVSREWDVPPQYLVAFWGLETNYGGFHGNTPTVSALATLACEGRRGEFFTAELFNALRILEEGAVSPERLRGSWAGALGQMQFMPSVFLEHAVDGDDDGKRDLWNSLPDAFSSAANFLADLGWREGERWGREVRLPKAEGFDFSLAGLDQRQTLEEWRASGVRLPDGSPLPRADLRASLLLPSGHRGPAFLVYHNFRVIMRWNRSQSYALAVGHLADRINGAGELSREPMEPPRLHRDQVEALQKKLNALDLDAGEEDGLLGPGTRAALARYQAREDLVADGFPDRRTLQRLEILEP